ncbi:MAG: hypothetical protein V4580_13940 [Bacteroidota bacterium]
MKGILLLLLICCTAKMNAQQQFNCYHIQEFIWNANTNLYDTPIERADQSKFKIDKEKKFLVQTFEDGVSTSHAIKSYSYDDSKNIATLSIISPSNGYTYIYRINSNSLVIEVSLANSGKESLLKKYLYKN